MDKCENPMSVQIRYGGIWNIIVIPQTFIVIWEIIEIVFNIIIIQEFIRGVKGDVSVVRGNFWIGPLHI